MEDFTIWQYSQVPLTVTQGDPDSVSATIVLELQDSSVSTTVSKTGVFEDIDGVTTADLTLDESHTAAEGVYSYKIFENFTDESPLIYPDPNNCDGECELPTITICESSPNDDVS